MARYPRLKLASPGAVQTTVLDIGSPSGPSIGSYSDDFVGVTPTRDGRVNITFTSTSQSAYWDWDVSSLEQNVAVKVNVAQIPSGHDYSWEMWLRINGSNGYLAEGEVTTAGNINARLVRVNGGVNTTLVSQTNIYTGISADTDYYIRFETTGSSPTTFRGKAWLASDEEPGTWVVTTSDGSGPQVAGAVRWGFYTDSGTTFPYTVSWDNFVLNLDLPVEDEPGYDITVTSTIQAAVDASSPGGTIYVPAGTYRETVDIDKENLSITFADGAIIDGRSSGGSYDRNRWITISEDGVTLINPQAQYTAYQAGGSGIFNNFRDNLTILGGTFGPARGSYVANLGGGNNLLVDGTEFFGGIVAVAYGPGGSGGKTGNVFRNCNIHDANVPQPHDSWIDTAGYSATPGYTGVFTDYPYSNYIDGSSVPGGYVWWNEAHEAGGMKGFHHWGLIIEHSWVHDNYGVGIWSDSLDTFPGGSKNLTIRRCLIEDNTSNGIFFEVSDRLDAYENHLRGNGLYGSTFSVAHPQIAAGSGRGAYIYNNVIQVQNNKAGIMFFNQDRPTDSPVSHDDNAAYDNDIIFDSGAGGYAIRWGNDAGAGNAYETYWNTSYAKENRFWYSTGESATRWNSFLEGAPDTVPNITSLVTLNTRVGGQGREPVAASSYLTTDEKDDILAGDPSIAGGRVVANAGILTEEPFTYPSSFDFTVGVGGITTIQAAITAAGAGDKILVPAGTYAPGGTIGSIPSGKDGLEIWGPQVTLGNSPTAILSGGTDGLVINSNRVKLVYLKFQNQTDDGIEHGAASDLYGLTIAYCEFTGQQHRGVDTAGMEWIYIYRTSFHDIGTTGQVRVGFVPGQVSSTSDIGRHILVEDSKFYNCQGSGGVGEGGGTKDVGYDRMTFRHCEFYNNSMSIWTDSTVNNNLSANTIVEYCYFHDNNGSGIFFEISDSLIARYNYFYNNGIAPPSASGTAGHIHSSSSRGSLIYDNVMHQPASPNTGEPQSVLINARPRIDGNAPDTRGGHHVYHNAMIHFNARHAYGIYETFESGDEPRGYGDPYVDNWGSDNRFIFPSGEASGAAKFNYGGTVFLTGGTNTNSLATFNGTEGGGGGAGMGGGIDSTYLSTNDRDLIIAGTVDGAFDVDDNATLAAVVPRAGTTW